MNFHKVKESQNNIVTHIINRDLNKAFSNLEKVINEKDIAVFSSDLNGLKDTYKNLLRYSFEYGNDPQRAQVYQQLGKSLLEINDNIHLQILKNQRLDTFYQTNIDVNSLLLTDVNDKVALVNEIIHEREIDSLMKESGTKKETSSQPGIIELNLEKIFNILAFTNTYNEGEVSISRKFIDSELVSKHEKSLIVAAIFISLNRKFEEKKCTLLFEFFEKDESIVSQRALISLLLILFLYEKRLTFYPAIIDRLKSNENSNTLRLAEAILLQYIKARDTDRISKKIQDEIIPEVIKMKDDLEDKLKLNDLLKEKSFEDENPDWKEFFGDSPDVYKKFEEFSMMQLDGNDVYMSAFSMLKNFPFFQHISNWFLLFNPEHSEIKTALQKLGDSAKYQTFIDGLENSSILCNSDKFSFCFNIQYMPEMQQNMMIEMFNMEIKAMNEMEKEESKHLTQNKDRVITTQYLQDLYRFHKLHPLKKHFSNIFTFDIAFEKSLLIEELLDNDGLRKVGELYFSKGYYREAIAVFKSLLQKNSTPELLEKIAFGYQKLLQYTKALKYYKQAEILNTNKTWLLKKIAFCHKNLGQIEDAISYYKRVDTMEEDNEENQIYLGNLYLESSQFDDAMKHYYKVEYNNPENVKVLRPIGWCYFVSGKADKAIGYFEKVTNSKNANKNDFINLGHAYWVSGNLSAGLESYRKSIQLSENDFSWFTKVVNTDKEHLFNYNIDELEVSLLTDYLAIDID